LGLAIIKAIVANHGGQINAYNHPEGGAVFTITFPVQEKPSREVKKVDVMIALTEETLRYPMEQVLKASGFSVSAPTAVSEVQLWEMLYLPRIIVFDLDKVAEMGFIQKMWPNVKRVAVGEPDYTDKTEGLMIIPKPIDYGRLVDEIRSLMNG